MPLLRLTYNVSPADLGEIQPEQFEQQFEKLILEKNPDCKIWVIFEGGKSQTAAIIWDNPADSAESIDQFCDNCAQRAIEMIKQETKEGTP